MLSLLLSIAVVFVLLVISETLWRNRQLHPEIMRKFTHISVGSFVAFWPFYMSWQQIEFLSVAFLVVVGISQFLGIFQAIHSVQRPTWGEYLFAITVGLLTFVVQNNKWVYLAAVLQMSLADGLAAVVGTLYGRSNAYKVFGYTKSLAGTATFFVVSLIVLFGYMALGGVHNTSVLMVFGLALGATVLENLMVHGFDNLIVPLFIALMLV